MPTGPGSGVKSPVRYGAGPAAAGSRERSRRTGHAEGREGQTPETAGQEEVANMSRSLAAPAAARQAPVRSPNRRPRWLNRRLPGAAGPPSRTPPDTP